MRVEQSVYFTIGRMKRSYLGGFRVKPSPTKQTLVTIRFQAFFCRLPVRTTFNTSVSPCARTFGRGTSHLPYEHKNTKWGPHFNISHHTTKSTIYYHVRLFLMEYSKLVGDWVVQFCANANGDTHSFLLPLLFDHVGEDLGPRLTLSV